jgi:hypothetical protein
METDYHYDYGDDGNDNFACCVFRRNKRRPITAARKDITKEKQIKTIK